MLEKIKSRFLAKVYVDPVTGCWLWRGHVAKISGYGQAWDGNKVRYAHQLSYELFVSPIPEDMEPHHTCHVRRCVNPHHLEALTHRENLLRDDTIPARKAAQTHCIHGHPLSGDNLRIAKNGTRSCLTCRKQKYNNWLKNNRERRREIDRQYYARRKLKKITHL